MASKPPNTPLFTVKGEFDAIRELIRRSRERACTQTDINEIASAGRAPLASYSNAARRYTNEWNLTRGIVRRGGGHLELRHREIQLPKYRKNAPPVYGLIASSRQAAVTFVLYEQDRSGAYCRLMRDLYAAECDRWKPRLPIPVHLVEELPDDEFTSKARIFGSSRNGEVDHPFARAHTLYRDKIELTLALPR